MYLIITIPLPPFAPGKSVPPTSELPPPPPPVLVVPVPPFPVGAIGAGKLLSKPPPPPPPNPPGAPDFNVEAQPESVSYTHLTLPTKA